MVERLAPCPAQHCLTGQGPGEAEIQPSFASLHLGARPFLPRARHTLSLPGCVAGWLHPNRGAPLCEPFLEGVAHTEMQDGNALPLSLDRTLPKMQSVFEGMLTQSPCFQRDSRVDFCILVLENRSAVCVLEIRGKGPRCA